MKRRKYNSITDIGNNLILVHDSNGRFFITNKEFQSTVEKYYWSIFLYRDFWRVRTSLPKIGNKKGMLDFTRAIMNPSKNQLVDHINTETLDNRKENLRCCDNRGNHLNARKHRSYKGIPCSSIYKGVDCPKGNKWRATGHGRGKNNKIHLGYFDSEEAAGKAYNDFAIANYGEFALLNII